MSIYQVETTGELCMVQTATSTRTKERKNTNKHMDRDGSTQWVESQLYRHAQTGASQCSQFMFPQWHLHSGTTYREYLLTYELIYCRPKSLSELSKRWLRPRTKTDHYHNGSDWELVTPSVTTPREDTGEERRWVSKHLQIYCSVL